MNEVSAKNTPKTMVEIKSSFSKPLRVWNTDPDESDPLSAPPF